MKKLLFVIILLQVLISCNSNYIEKDIELWKETEIWDFAKYISKNEFENAEEMIIKYRIDVDCKEPKYGETLLSWAVLNDNLDVVKFLIGHGANPNSHNTYNGMSPITDAAGGSNSKEILRYLLLHGGNPNDYVKENEVLTHGRSIKTPLIAAAFVSLEKTKMLVEVGADVNFAVEPGYTSFHQAALRLKKDILEYLLLNCKMDYSKTYTVTLDTGDTLYLKEIIRNDKVAYRQDSVAVKRLLDYIEKHFANLK